VTNWSVWVTGGDAASFPAFEYRPDNSGLGEGSGGEIEFVVPGSQRQILFRRSVPLTGTPVYVPLDLSSPNDIAYESYGGASPKRLIEAGALFTDPTPTRIRWFFDLALVDGGAVSGYADHSPDDASVLKWALTVKGGDQDVFPPLTYLPANSDPDFSTLGPGRYLHLLVEKTPPADPRALRYTGLARMGADGGRMEIDTVNSLECYSCGVYRLFSGGTLRGVTDEIWGDGFE
jgi:hypothetical protein